MIINEVVGKPGVGKTSAINNITNVDEVLIVFPENYSNTFARLKGALFAFMLSVLHLQPLSNWLLTARIISSFECKINYLLVLRSKIQDPRSKIQDPRSIKYILLDEGIIRSVRDTKYTSTKQKKILYSYFMKKLKMLSKVNIRFHSIVLLLDEEERISRIQKRSFARNETRLPNGFNVKNKILKIVNKIEGEQGFRDYELYQKFLEQGSQLTESIIQLSPSHQPQQIAEQITAALKRI